MVGDKRLRVVLDALCRGLVSGQLSQVSFRHVGLCGKIHELLVGHAASWNLEPDSNGLYEQHYGSVDVWATRARLKTTGFVCWSTSLCPLHELRETEFYNDFLLRYDIEDGLFARGCERCVGMGECEIGAPTNTRVWIAAGVTDLRRGFTGLSALVESKLEQKPFSGHVFVFRGRRGDLIKVLWYDGDGLCLFAKRLERGRFVWPQAASGTVSLTRALLSMLLEGIDWRRPERTWEPQLSV